MMSEALDFAFLKRMVNLRFLVGKVIQAVIGTVVCLPRPITKKQQRSV